jgi:hypothetical protein
MIYVDEARWPFRGSLYCHMVSDEPEGHEELMEFALKLGLKPAWLQKAGTPRVHFDLSPKMRAKAVKQGAIEITWREFFKGLAVKGAYGEDTKDKVLNGHYDRQRSDFEPTQAIS